MTAVFAAAMREWRRTINRGVTEVQKIRTSLQQRIKRVMGVTIQREMEGLERFMGFLASCWLRRHLYWPVRHGLGDYEQLSGRLPDPRTPA
jgi:hypothetical protein